MKKIKWQLLSCLIMVAIMLTACGTQSTTETQETNAPKGESITENEPATTDVVSAFIEQYNTKTDIPITNPIEIDIHASEYYRTEFRLNAFKNAVAKRCSIGEATIDIINYGNLSNDSIRFYLKTDDKEFAVQVFKTAVSIFDPDATDKEINDAVEAIMAEKNGNYLNDIGFYYISSYHELFVDNTNIDFFTAD